MISDYFDTVYTTEDTFLFNELREEMKRQRKKWGDQKHSPEMWNAIFDEEKEEMSRAIVEHDEKSYRKELIHAAAVLMSAAYCHIVHGLCSNEREERLEATIVELLADIKRLSTKTSIGRIVSVSERPNLIIEDPSYE